MVALQLQIDFKTSSSYTINVLYYYIPFRINVSFTQKDHVYSGAKASIQYHILIKIEEKKEAFLVNLTYTDE